MVTRVGGAQVVEVQAQYRRLRCRSGLLLPTAPRLARSRLQIKSAKVRRTVRFRQTLEANQLADLRKNFSVKQNHEQITLVSHRGLSAELGAVVAFT